MKLLHLKIMTGIILISFSPIPVKIVSFTPGAGAFYRTFYAFIILLLISIFRRSQEFKPIKKSWFFPVVLAGLFLGIDFTLWHISILNIGAGPATFLGNSQVIFVTFFALIFFKEPVAREFPFLVGIIFLGLYLLVPKSQGAFTLNEGYLLGLLVGVSYSGMLICFRYASDNTPQKEYPEILSLAFIMLIASLISALFSVFWEKNSLFNWDLKNHLWMFFVALCSQSLGWILIKKNITKMPVHKGSLLLLLQPVLSFIWGKVFFNEPLTKIQFIGILFTLGGIAYLILNRKEPKPDISTEPSLADSPRK